MTSLRRFLGSLPVLPTAIAVMIALRLVQFRMTGSPDEGGFLVLAGQWSSSGSSLYGDYWVDRPPLLIALFQLADTLGGLVALRLIGMVVAVVTVLLLAATARRVYGDRAGLVAGVVAAALLATPLYGTDDVNGELLALPFLALGLRAATEAVLAERTRTARLSALVAGAAAVAAVLVKQNIIDVVVFAALFWVIAWRLGQVSFRRLTELTATAVAGAGLTYAAVMGWALAHGTTPGEIYEATYPFRLKAARVIASTAGVAEDSGERLGWLTLAFVGSGVPLLIGLFLLRGLWRSGRPAFAVAVLGMIAWSTFSLLAGGSYWFHYLVESLPGVALAAGAVSVVSPRWLHRATAFVVLSAIVAPVVAVVVRTPVPMDLVADALADARRPGDTMLSAFGDPEILRVTGMSSPYEYPWSLPARTLDPDMDDLRAVLSGPEAPTWIVVRGQVTEVRLERGGAMPIIERRYRKVAVICARTVWLRDGVVRPTPVNHVECPDPR